MTVLVLADHDNHQLSAVTAAAVTAAGELGGGVHVLVAGSECRPAAEEAARIAGVETVLLADAPHYAHGLAEPLAALMAPLATGYDAVVAAATAKSKAVLPRLAAMLDAVQISEVTQILAPDLFERPVYAGAANATVKAPPGLKVITVRTTAFARAGDGGCAVIRAIPPGTDPGLTVFEGATLSQSGRPELTTARVVIAAGRGVQTKDNLELLERIAARLNGAIGASRAAVDSGLLPNDVQVGQTGKAVAPELYLAAGISGAIQHLCGMKDSRLIAAINKDSEAAIFRVADIGLVADLSIALPELDAELARRGRN